MSAETHMTDYGKALLRIAELKAELAKMTKAWNKREDEWSRQAQKYEAELVVERNLTTSAHQAENAKQKALDNMRHRAEQAEAELAALKGRRCDDCEHFTYLTCPVWPSVHRANTYAPPTPGFYCSSWAERGTP